MPLTLEQLLAARGGGSPIPPDVRECPDLARYGPYSRRLIHKLTAFGPPAEIRAPCENHDRCRPGHHVTAVPLV